MDVTQAVIQQVLGTFADLFSSDLQKALQSFDFLFQGFDLILSLRIR